MSFGGNVQPDPEDYFNDTRMSFGDHLEELRAHLIRAILGFLIAMFLSFFVGKLVLRLIAAPVEDQLVQYWERYAIKKKREVSQALRDGTLDRGAAYDTKIRIDVRELKRALNLKTEDNPPALDLVPAFQPVLSALQIDDWVDAKQITGARWAEIPVQMVDMTGIASEIAQYDKIVGRKPTLSTLNVQEAFVVYIKVSVVTGLVISSPWIFYQLWSFIAAGLYPHEKRYVNVFLPASIGLFLAGVVLCELFVIPKAVEALLWFNEWLELEPDFRLNEWLGFAIFMPVVFGLSFQTPLVMLFLERIGILTVEAYRGMRRIAWFVMLIFAAVITPSTDAFSLLLLWVPMCLLYDLGIILIQMQPPRERFEMEDEETDSLIGV